MNTLLLHYIYKLNLSSCSTQTDFVHGEEAKNQFNVTTCNCIACCITTSLQTRDPQLSFLCTLYQLTPASNFLGWFMFYGLFLIMHVTGADAATERQGAESSLLVGGLM